MALYLALGALTAATLALLLVPLLRARAGTEGRAGYDAAVYRDQLAELDRDRERGVISAAEYEAARAEVARRLLAVGAERGRGALAGGRHAPLVALGVGLAVPLAAGGLYLALGQPELAIAPPPTVKAEAAGQHTADLEAMVAKLAARLKRQPDNLEGWVMLARSYATLERFDAAIEAADRALALSKGDPELLGLRAEYQVFAAAGTVTPKAVADFTAVLAARPRDPASHYYLGLADIQAGRERAGLDTWLALARDAPPGAPWLGELTKRIRTVAKRFDIDVTAELAAVEAPAPGAAAVAAAAAMSPEDRQAMIAGMVQRLADRLAAEPGDADGWLRLSRAYRVLGKDAKAKEALAGAAKAIATLAPDDPRRGPLTKRLAALRAGD